MKIWQENLATFLSIWKIQILLFTEEVEEAKWLVNKQPSRRGLMHLKFQVICVLGFKNNNFVKLFNVEKHLKYSIFWHCLKFTVKHTYLSRIRLINWVGWVVQASVVDNIVGIEFRNCIVDYLNKDTVRELWCFGTWYVTFFLVAYI